MTQRPDALGNPPESDRPLTRADMIVRVLGKARAMGLPRGVKWLRGVLRGRDELNRLTDDELAAALKE